MVVVGFDSERDDAWEVRRLGLQCGSVPQAFAMGAAQYRSWIGWPESSTSDTCPSGQVLVGLDTARDDQWEIRRFRLRCAPLPPGLDQQQAKAGWFGGCIGKCNGCCSPSSDVCSGGAAVVGLTLQRDDAYEIRRLKLTCGSA